MSRPVWLLSVSLALCALVGCGHPPNSDATSDEPRVVVLNPAVAVTMRDLGYGPWIVGRHGWDEFSEQSLPACGDQNGLNYEAILSTNPTHVLIAWGAREPPERLASLAEPRGWEVRDIDPLSLDDVGEAARTLVDLFGEAPSEANATPTAIEAALSRQSAAIDLSVLPVLASGEIAALGPGSFHHDLLARCGVVPLPETGGPYQRLNAEDIAALQPDAIIVFRPRPADAPKPDIEPGSMADAERTAALLGRVPGLDMPATSDDRLGMIDHPLALLPSSQLVAVRTEIETLLAAWISTPASLPSRHDDNAGQRDH
ncbi:MAG: hypothetical protein AAF747_04160 [Planctomycetota bacterium]